MAIRWLLQQDIVSSVVVGSTSVDQLEDNIGAAKDWELSHQEVDMQIFAIESNHDTRETLTLVVCDHAGTACADPDSFVRGCFFFVDEGREDPSTTIGWPSSARQQSAINNIECWLGSCDFQGIPTSIAREPYIFVIFQRDPDPLPPPPSGSAHVQSNLVNELLC